MVSYFWPNTGIMAQGLAKIDGPVSYTHLDVYKRQEAQSSRQKIAAELEQVQSELTRQYDRCV